jgi:hypothetical protein
MTPKPGNFGVRINPFAGFPLRETVNLLFFRR